MSITNTFPYVTLRTYQNISDEDLEKCSYRDLLELDFRHEINKNAEVNKNVGLGYFLMVEREELINSLSYEQWERMAMESFKHEDEAPIMALFFQSYFAFLHNKKKHERWILDGRYDSKPEEKMLVDRLLAKDEETFLSVGTIDLHDKYPRVSRESYVEATEGEYVNHKQYRDAQLDPKMPKNFPAA